MFHTIEFAVDFTVDMEVSRKKPLERVCMQKGTRRRAQFGLTLRKPPRALLR